MKLITFLLLSLLFIIVSCSKDNPARSNTGNPSPPPPPAIMPHVIDLNFTLTPSCYIAYDTGYLPLAEKSFILSASGTGNIDGVTINIYGYVNQAYEYYSNHYSIAGISISESIPINKFSLQFTGADFFNLPYNGGAANFSGACIVSGGIGRYLHLSRSNLSSVVMSGTADPYNNTGQFRIHGTLYY